jgi:hypothetical protein
VYVSFYLIKLQNFSVYCNAAEVCKLSVGGRVTSKGSNISPGLCKFAVTYKILIIPLGRDVRKHEFDNKFCCYMKFLLLTVSVSDSSYGEQSGMCCALLMSSVQGK